MPNLNMIVRIEQSDNSLKKKTQCKTWMKIEELLQKKHLLLAMMRTEKHHENSKHEHHLEMHANPDPAVSRESQIPCIVHVDFPFFISSLMNGEIGSISFYM